MMMEIERLKAIKAEMDREERAALARKRGAQVIIDQIASREEIRQKEAETLEQEKQQLLFNIEKNKKEDLEAVKARKERFRIMNEEVIIANKKQKEQKAAAKDAERKLDDQIAEHQKRVIQREQDEIREKIRINAEKEKEVQRQREAMERMQDRAANLDAFRAQKAYEKAEIAYRIAEEEKKQKHEAAIKKLHIDRQKQFADIDMRLKQKNEAERAAHVETIRRVKQME